MGVHWTCWKINGILTGWQVEPQIFSFNQTYLDKGFGEADLRSRELEQLSLSTN